MLPFPVIIFVLPIFTFHETFEGLNGVSITIRTVSLSLAAVGVSVGLFEGDADGDDVILLVGSRVVGREVTGAELGLLEGDADGEGEGLDVLGTFVGLFEGLTDGAVGFLLGGDDGGDVVLTGDWVGNLVGLNV